MILFSKWRGAAWWSALTIAACALVLVSNTVYLGGGPTPRFLLEKGDLAQQPWWLAAFYFHVIGASICLAAGTPLMFPAWTRRHPAWHRRLGYVYLNAVLWMAAPSGLVLAMVAKGGLLGAAGFTLAGLAWWYTTWAGYRAVRRGDLAAHVRCMVRSYSWALSAPAFRAIQVVLFLCGVADGPNYVLSLWLSIAASVWLAESFLAHPHRPRAGGSMTEWLALRGSAFPPPPTLVGGAVDWPLVGQLTPADQSSFHRHMAGGEASVAGPPLAANQQSTGTGPVVKCPLRSSPSPGVVS
jgi:hypothetical protein